MTVSLEDLKRRRPVNEEAYAQAQREIEEEQRAYELRQLRKKQHLTQKQLADLMHTQQHRISQIENGDIDNLSIETLQKFVNVLGSDFIISVREPQSGEVHDIYKSPAIA